MKRMEIEETTQDNCSGRRNPEQCPYNGEFNSESDECKECCEDAMKAFEEEGRRKNGTPQD